MKAESQSQSFTERFLKGEALFGAWGFVARGIGLVNSFFILSALSLVEYGSFQLLLSLLAMLSSLRGLGGSVISVDLLRYLGSEKMGHAKKLFFDNLKLRGILAVFLWAVMFFGAPLMSGYVGGATITAIRIFSFLIPLDYLQGVARSLLNMKLLFGSIASRSSLAKIAQAMVLAYFYFFGVLTVQIVGISIIVGSLFTLLVLFPKAYKSFMVLSRHTAFRGKLLWPIFRSYGKWEVISKFVVNFTTHIQPWLINFFIGEEAVAIFSVAKTMIGIVTNVFPSGTLDTMIPMLIKDRSRAQRVFMLATKYMIVISIILGLGAFALAWPIISLAFPKYVVSLPYFYAMLPTLPFTAFAVISAIFLGALRKQKFLFAHRLLKSAIVIPLYVIILPLFGLWGLIIQVLIVTLIMFAHQYWYFRFHRVGVRLHIRKLFVLTPDDRVFLKEVFRRGGIGNFTQWFKHT